MKFSVTNFVWMAIIALGAFGLYLVKYSVQEVQRDVARMEAKLKQEKETMHLLRAEWAYLNRPERLRELAKGRVEAEPVTTSHIIDVARLPVQDALLAVMNVDAAQQNELMHQVSSGGLFVPVVAR